ncbi:YceI family protein [Thalassolituus sp. LLYu03]|uniref:YceI family protein n=1 Tax=Thalassolituus sp. LLYu03 TaxID=3421656 RepID=UPI003D282DB8
MRLLLAMVALLSAAAHADWTLTADSSVNFLTTKNTNLTEIHHFRAVQGSIAKSGVATLNIDLTSVDTTIPVRDQRMRDILFETNRFTTAVFTTVLNPDVMKKAADGKPLLTQVAGKLALHGNEEDVQVSVMVTPARDGSLVVSSVQPVLVHADAFSLTAGIQKLREIAGLERIADVVPVNFTLTFSKASE